MTFMNTKLFHSTIGYTSDSEYLTYEFPANSNRRNDHHDARHFLKICSDCNGDENGRPHYAAPSCSGSLARCNDVQLIQSIDILISWRQSPSSQRPTLRPST